MKKQLCCHLVTVGAAEALLVPLAAVPAQLHGPSLERQIAFGAFRGKVLIPALAAVKLVIFRPK